MDDKYCHVRNRLEQVLVNSKLSLWDPAVKIVIGQLLIEREVIMAEDVEKIFGKRPWASRSEEILEEESKDDNAPVVENKDKVEP